MEASRRLIAIARGCRFLSSSAIAQEHPCAIGCKSRALARRGRLLGVGTTPAALS